jgi:dUTP pyrophosphatase
MQVKFQKVREGAVIPEYHSAKAAGFDLAIVQDEVIAPGESKLCPTGLVVQAPANHMLLIVPRSSTHRKWGLTLANTVGIVDEDFCGPEDELQLFLQRDEPGENGSEVDLSDISDALFGHWKKAGDEKDFSQRFADKMAEKYTIPAGTRLAQGIFVPVTQAEFILSEGPIAKNRGGWGSTG